MVQASWHVCNPLTGSRRRFWLSCFAPQDAAPAPKVPSERNARDAAAWAVLAKQGDGAKVECKVRGRRAV